MSVEGAAEMFDLGEGPSVNALGKEGSSSSGRGASKEGNKVASVDNRRCWVCGKKGHLSKDCWKRKPYPQKGNGNGNGQGKNNGQGYKGRRWNGRRNGGNNQRHAVNAMEGEQGQQQEDDGDQEPDYAEAYGAQEGDKNSQGSSFQ